MKVKINRIDNEFTQKDYIKRFLEEKEIRKNALEIALDTRKYEIDLYWKRAAYFWTFIGVTFAGYFTVQASDVMGKQDISVLLSCLGVVFSFAWLLVNKGSKRWQENWENHVAMLEDTVAGPLHKVVLSRNSPSHSKCWEKFGSYVSHMIIGPGYFSVSRINQIISLYITLLWIGLLMHSLRLFDNYSEFNVFYTLVIGLSLFTCLLFFLIGRSYTGSMTHKGTLTSSNITNE